MRYVLELTKAQPVESEEGVLTKRGTQVAHEYALAWLRGIRNLELERKHPQLSDLFYDIRIDTNLARNYAKK